MRYWSLVAIGLASSAHAHGGGQNEPEQAQHQHQQPAAPASVPSPGADAAAPDWMTRHMVEEHHVTGFDADSFFSLHDYNGDGMWDDAEVLRTYGLQDASNRHVALDRRAQVATEVRRLLDADGDGRVSRAEFAAFVAAGGALPDLGTGPGHHGDDEYEYEIHHWEKYHDENTKLEDLTHPEDIEHFKKHEEMEEEQERIDQQQERTVVEENIPAMFLRVQQ